MRSVDSLLVSKGGGPLLVVAGLGDSGERCVVGQVRVCHRQGPWVAKQQCSSTCYGPQARRSRHVSGVEKRLTAELLHEIREFIEEENGRMSVNNV